MKLRYRKCGGMFYIERCYFRFLWWPVFDMGIDGTMVPRVFFNREAAKLHCRICK